MLPDQQPCQEQAATHIDYQALASALVGAMQQAGVVGSVSIVEEKVTSLSSPVVGTRETMEVEHADATTCVASQSLDKQPLRHEPRTG